MNLGNYKQQQGESMNYQQQQGESMMMRHSPRRLFQTDVNPLSSIRAISRREFNAAAGAASVQALGGCLAAPPSPPSAIDGHVHFFSRRMYPHAPADNPFRTETPAEFMSMASPVGVTGVVVIEAFPSIEDNQWALDLAQQNPAILGYIGYLEPGEKDFPRQLDRFAANPLFRGIRPHRLFSDLAGCFADPVFHHHLALLNDRGLTFEWGGQADSWAWLIRLAREYTQMRFICHPAGLLDSSRKYTAESRTVLEKAALVPNIYAKATLQHGRNNQLVRDPAVYRPQLEIYFSVFGPDRVLYASNWPPSYAGGVSYRTIHQLTADYVLSLGSERAEKFFWRNSVAAFGLEASRVHRVIAP
jgi:predicted TIM-barrel fold metal-dependent hydrolase